MIKVFIYALNWGSYVTNNAFAEAWVCDSILKIMFLCQILRAVDTHWSHVSQRCVKVRSSNPCRPVGNHCARLGISFTNFQTSPHPHVYTHTHTDTMSWYVDASAHTTWVSIWCVYTHLCVCVTKCMHTLCPETLTMNFSLLKQ